MSVTNDRPAKTVSRSSPGRETVYEPSVSAFRSTRRRAVRDCRRRARASSASAENVQAFERSLSPHVGHSRGTHPAASIGLTTSAGEVRSWRIGKQENVEFVAEGTLGPPRYRRM